MVRGPTGKAGGDGRGQMDVEEFLERDAALNAAWTRFKATHFTQNNRLLSALADLPMHSRTGGGFLRKVNTDAAIVRLLEVAGYIDFTGVASGGAGSKM